VSSAPLPKDPDGPSPFRVHNHGRVEAWKVVQHEQWIELEVDMWISGLHWDPWQHPSVMSAPPGATSDEVRTAVVPATRVGISYMVVPRAKMVWLIEVADLP
jgi:hypothetical protein